MRNLVSGVTVKLFCVDYCLAGSPLHGNIYCVRCRWIEPRAFLMSFKEKPVARAKTQQVFATRNQIFFSRFECILFTEREHSSGISFSAGHWFPHCGLWGSFEPEVHNHALSRVPCGREWRWTWPGVLGSDRINRVIMRFHATLMHNRDGSLDAFLLQKGEFHSGRELVSFHHRWISASIRRYKAVYSRTEINWRRISFLEVIIWFILCACSLRWQ